MGAILIQATTEAVLWTNSMASSTWECVRTAALSQDLGVPIIPKYSAPPSPFPVLGARPPSINASGVGEENSGVVALVSYHCSETNGGVEVGKLHRQITETRTKALGKLLSHEKPKQSPRVGTEQGVQFLIQERQEQIS